MAQRRMTGYVTSLDLELKSGDTYWRHIFELMCSLPEYDHAPFFIFMLKCGQSDDCAKDGVEELLTKVPCGVEENQPIKSVKTSVMPSIMLKKFLFSIFSRLMTMSLLSPHAL